MALGRKLVEELGIEPSVDTLDRWMAHYIADLIVKAENATDEEKSLAEQNCFEAIMVLWKHRAELPNGKRPFENLEPVIRAIESLDPENETPRYFRSSRWPNEKNTEQSEADSWLAMVDGLDYSAKVLIGYCLSEAARAAVDKSVEWVKLADAAEAEQGVPEIVIRFVSSNADLGKDLYPNADVRRRQQEKIKRLEGFMKLAESVASDLKAKLESFPLPEEDVDITAETLSKSEPKDPGDI
ncbi:MAG: hypothetical protein A3K90_04240 [Pelodictyon luteolum]|uniref:Uncharacterized protein n=1 Tax=Pelodictyon luteolum TaxID=1100 RepID=A0A165MHB0_PELLU|nr:MAG: hypothetical protein A3K90_04240 [Pelodictyon luteolum]TCD47511.1 hypothetical protein E0L29_07465 [Chlorobium sp. N1]